MADYTETLKNIKPQQWALIAGAGIGLGLLLRMRKKKTAVTAGTTDTPFTTNDTQQYGAYSGTGQTGYYNGGASVLNPNAASGPGNPAISTGPAPGDIKQVTNKDGTFTTFYWNGFEWVVADRSTPQIIAPAPAPEPVAAAAPQPTFIPTPAPQPAPSVPRQYFMGQANYQADRAASLPYVYQMISGYPIQEPGYGPNDYRLIEGTHPFRGQNISTLSEIYADYYAHGIDPIASGLPSIQEIQQNPTKYGGYAAGNVWL